MKAHTRPRPAPPILHRGFTLVELLIVIVIIAALASITFLIAKKSMDRAAMMKTMGNMRQLSTLSKVFSSENNDAIMDTWQTIASDGQKRNWCEHILVILSPDLATNKDYMNAAGDTFAKSIALFADPKALKQAGAQLASSGHFSWRTIAYNNRIGAFTPKEPGTNPWKQGAKYGYQVSSPNKLLLYAQPTLTGDKFNYFAQPGDAVGGKIDFDLHAGKSIVGFYDGHVELYDKKHYPANGGINPTSGKAYTNSQINEFWFGSTTPFTAP